MLCLVIVIILLLSHVNCLQLFAVMFPDSKIASQIELGRMKLKYIVNFGLGPHFRDVLKYETAVSEWYSISFDDSLNKVVQECEMDILMNGAMEQWPSR